MIHARKAPAADHGFTLIELLVVLGLFSVAALVALPLANAGRHAHQLEAGAIALASELKQARAAAMRTNAEQIVEIDTARGTYATLGATRPHGLPTGMTSELTTIRSERTSLATGRVRFYPDGSATGARVVLRSGTRTAAVTVDWLTGGTRVEMRN